MNQISQRFSLTFHALRQIGLRPLALYGLYRLGLLSGHYKRTMLKEAARQVPLKSAELRGMPLPTKQELEEILGDRIRGLISEADEVVAGKVHLFGGPPVPLQLTIPGKLEYWTEYEKGRWNTQISDPGMSWIPEEARCDIKYIWEPGRFGWAFLLARANYLSQDERYAQAFWINTETFLSANPPGYGPHWTSAQEVALRLMALVFAGQVFALSESATPDRKALLGQAIADHARRIPPTLVYARSQNNNHLLTEAAGLYTAGVFLSDHPSAYHWRELGWRWIQRGFQSQIEEDGAYTQNSANYHRLMLNVACWVKMVAQLDSRHFPQESALRISAACRWLLGLVDPLSGRVPNMGPNDGANILPLSCLPFDDYRPALQAACQCFLGERPFPDGPWDEVGCWLGIKGERFREDEKMHSPHVLRSPSGDSWAYYRFAHHRSRPGHADQLHLDLWWRGLNIALDPGTYLYNGLPPWENALTGAFVHNTLTVDGQDQMRRAGRFLWLDWAQAQVISSEPNRLEERIRNPVSLIAQHDGYRKLGVIHEREVIAQEDGSWRIIDRLIPMDKKREKQSYSTRLHWLFPDWPWELECGDKSIKINLRSPRGPVCLQISYDTEGILSPQLIRAGELMYGAGEIQPVWGWYSPTYGQKQPALSLALSVLSSLPVNMTSDWSFPEG